MNTKQRRKIKLCVLIVFFAHFTANYSNLLFDRIAIPEIPSDNTEETIINPLEASDIDETIVVVNDINFHKETTNDSIINQEIILDLSSVINFGSTSFMDSLYNMQISQSSLALLSGIVLIVNVVIYSTRKETKASPIQNYLDYRADLLVNSQYTSISSLQDIISEVIYVNPGIHFTKICETLCRENGVIQYHLQNLENNDKSIISHYDGGFHRYFPNIPVFQDEYTRDVLSEFHHQTSSKIIQEIFQSENQATNQFLRERIGVSRQCISKCCNELVSKGILLKSKLGKQNLYKITPSTFSIISALGMI